MQTRLTIQQQQDELEAAVRDDLVVRVINILITEQAQVRAEQVGEIMNLKSVVSKTVVKIQGYTDVIPRMSSWKPSCLVQSRKQS